MKAFADFGEMAEFLVEVEAAAEIAQTEALVVAAQIVKAEAKRVIGEGYDYPAPNTGPAPYDPEAAWPELAEFTKQDRVSQGFPADEPLLRTGELRDSIECCSDANQARIGSNSDIAVFQEMGTSRMPPRSYLGGAMVHKSEEIVAKVSEAVYLALASKGK